MPRLQIDGHPVEVPEGKTLWEAAKSLGIDIPVLCHDPGLPPAGVCRLCVVDTGERTLPAACVRPCEEGMEVRTATGEIQAHRRLLLELLLADYPAESLREQSTHDDLLLAQGLAFGAKRDRFRPGPQKPADSSSPVIHVEHQACILCDRCLRACNDLQQNHIMGRSGKGYACTIGFDLNLPMGESACVACGECQAACPTGALTNQSLKGLNLTLLPGP